MNSNSQKNTSESEEEHHDLYHTAHWAIISLKIPGYFLLSLYQKLHSSQIATANISQGTLRILSPNHDPYTSKHLTVITLRSLFQLDPYTIYFLVLFCTSCCLTVFTLIMGYDVLMKFSGGENAESSSDNADRFLSVYNVLAMTILSSSFRILFLIYRKNTFEFWLKQYQLHQRLMETCQSASACFKEVKRHVAKDAIYLWTISGIQTGSVFIYGGLVHLLQEKVQFKPVSGKIGAVWALCFLIVNAHVGLTIWTGFLIRFYSACFKTVKEEVDRLSKEKLHDNIKDITVQFKDGVFEINNQQESSTKLETLLELVEDVQESLEEFNKLYAFPVIVDVIISLGNALFIVYVVNRVVYEGGKQTWEMTFIQLFRIPVIVSYVVRLFYFINLSERLMETGQFVLRSLQLVKAGYFFGERDAAAILGKVRGHNGSCLPLLLSTITDAINGDKGVP